MLQAGKSQIRFRLRKKNVSYEERSRGPAHESGEHFSAETTVGTRREGVGEYKEQASTSSQFLAQQRPRKDTLRTWEASHTNQ